MGHYGVQGDVQAKLDGEKDKEDHICGNEWRRRGNERTTEVLWIEMTKTSSTMAASTTSYQIFIKLWSLYSQNTMCWLFSSMWWDLESSVNEPLSMYERTFLGWINGKGETAHIKVNVKNLNRILPANRWRAGTKVWYQNGGSIRVYLGFQEQGEPTCWLGASETKQLTRETMPQICLQGTEK